MKSCGGSGPMYPYIYIYVYVYIYIYVFILYVLFGVCVYIYIYIYIYIYVCVYICICMYRSMYIYSGFKGGHSSGSLVYTHGESWALVRIRSGLFRQGRPPCWPLPKRRRWASWALSCCWGGSEALVGSCSSPQQTTCPQAPRLQSPKGPNPKPLTPKPQAPLPLNFTSQTPYTKNLSPDTQPQTQNSKA